MSTSVKEHYDRLLARHYTWMFGDPETVIKRTEQWFEDHGLRAQGARRALDLGCGSGFQSIALARLGYAVDALDFCQPLVEELRMRARGLPVIAQNMDIRHFDMAGLRDFDLIVCMGDTLVHLESREEVRKLLGDCAHCLKSGGRLVLGFRDMTQALEGPARFVPVRSGTDVVFTCFLEYEPETVHVYDVIHTRYENEWTMHVSDYRKLRLDPQCVAGQAQEVGFTLDKTERDHGFVHIIATRQ